MKEGGCIPYIPTGFDFDEHNLIICFLGIQANIEHRSKRRNLGDTLDQAAERLIERYEVKEEDKPIWIQTLKEIEKEYKNEIPNIGLLLDIQYCLQQVIESLILADRKEYLKENNCNVQLVPIFPVQVSPRNMCLYAWK